MFRNWTLSVVQGLYTVSGHASSVLPRRRKYVLQSSIIVLCRPCQQALCGYPAVLPSPATGPNSYQVVYVQEISFPPSHHLHIRSKNIHDIVNNYHAQLQTYTQRLFPSLLDSPTLLSLTSTFFPLLLGLCLSTMSTGVSPLANGCTGRFGLSLLV